jgi:hypothetical protein
MSGLTREEKSGFTPNATDRKVLANVVKHGFTFEGDNLFRTIRQARVCLNRLVRAGWLTKVENAFRITEAGREAASLPVSHGLVLA